MSEVNPAALCNLLEPVGLVQRFLAFPPRGFSAFTLPGGVPAFSTSFDLLTTLEPAARRKIVALPFARWWRRFLRPLTCFVGTTISEYALLPRSMSAEVFVHALLVDVAPRYPFLIIKDIPTDAVLVGDASYRESRKLAAVCSENGFVLVEGQALAYVPMDFSSIEEYLARMSKSRRKDLTRKLRSARQLAVEAVPTGDAMFQDEKALAVFYSLYVNVYRQSEIHFDLLSPLFLKAVLQDRDSHGIVFVYRAGGELIGYNICFVENENLVDKYVGFVYPQAREHNLYTVSWFRNLEYALSRGLRCYVAGWTDPDIKRYLGATFTLTQHAVFVRNPALRKVLRFGRRFFETDHRWYVSHVAGADS